MIPQQSIGPFDQVYTWVRDDGRNFNICTSRLVDWVKTQKLETYRLPIDKSMVEKFINENAISTQRIRQMIERPPLDPIIMCLTGRSNINGIPGPEGMLVDGRHRYALHALLGLPAIPMYVLKPREWRPFRIAGLGKLTKQELKNVPMFNHILNKDGVS